MKPILRNTFLLPMRHHAVVFMVLCALAGCSGAGSANATEAFAQTPSNKESAMPNRTCAEDPLNRSVCMIELIVDDLKANFAMPSGGGISNIKATSSTSYAVSLPREERIQILTYEFDVRGSTITLKHRAESTQNF